MRHSSSTDQTKLSADSHRLIALATELFYASSYLESQFWQRQLETLVSKLLKHKKQSVLNEAVEYLFSSDMDIYNVLLEIIEARSESGQVVMDGKDGDVLLVVIPILALTRFSIASGNLTEAQKTHTATSLSVHIFAQAAQFILATAYNAVYQLPSPLYAVFAVMPFLA